MLAPMDNSPLNAQFENNMENPYATPGGPTPAMTHSMPVPDDQAQEGEFPMLEDDDFHDDVSGRRGDMRKRLNDRKNSKRGGCCACA